MKKVSVSDLRPGMVTAEDILSMNKNLIVPKGVVLTENIITRLESYSIYYAMINEDVSDEFKKPMLKTADTDLSDSSYPKSSGFDSLSSYVGSEISQIDVTDKDIFKKSDEFNSFITDYNHTAEHFEAMVTKAFRQETPLRSNDILRETLNLLNPNGYSVNIFDMLLNIHNTNDSIFNHCIDVALLSNVLSGWLGFSEADRTMATACGLFHDVGKLLLPQGILRKPAKLTPDEFEIIKTHTVEGFHLLSKHSQIPSAVKNAALMHHEKCDGSGYPYGLRGDEIDKFSKIVTIADIFDAMTSERVYRNAMCPFSVIKYFEDDGIQKYEIRYILTFLENVSNSYLNHNVKLSNGMEGNVIFINRGDYSRPVIRTTDNEILNLQDEYYRNIINLSNMKNVSIESII